MRSAGGDAKPVEHPDTSQVRTLAADIPGAASFRTLYYKTHFENDNIEPKLAILTSSSFSFFNSPRVQPLFPMISSFNAFIGFAKAASKFLP